MLAESLAANILARISTLPPGANGTIMRIGRCGYAVDGISWPLHGPGARRESANNKPAGRLPPFGHRLSPSSLLFRSSFILALGHPSAFPLLYVKYASSISQVVQRVSSLVRFGVPKASGHPF